ncbi:MAG: hypothetical protein KME07_17765 [Pegethrix bostrychoides GSE-TBD4-15B]|uniref:Uncharacterized protein n=1 Tax=Pegethrix bostrychoides GSE-TBD4-15B TaxID=2839662 RepID=A0A951PD86_9CYAN|nr:hypothetical protein [Pegethrix bostrychoides GSE-TBD4-15B]
MVSSRCVGIGRLAAGLMALTLLTAAPAIAQAATVEPTASPTEPAASAPRTALLTPELDSLLSSSLLWIIYLSFPTGLILAVWRYDWQARQQMIKFVEQAATLERIWQNPQAD